ncbi:MAG: hypothetical protein K2K10_03315 [Acetatifactor sp.]|nr:hypothetical protein [Acetatifactor sp.]
MEKREIVQNGSFIKNCYYPGKLLHASDFIKEQEYGSRKLEFMNRKFQGCGIIEGLEVQVRRDGGLSLTAGSAIDPRGRILLSPRDTKWEIDDIENLDRETEQDFILGIHYAEKPVETEQVFVNEDAGVCQVARVAETISLEAYSRDEWRRLWAPGSRGGELLVQEKVLYEKEGVRLVLRLPGLIPRDCIFRLRLQIQAAGKAKAHIRWRGVAKLQGAFFSASGKSFQILEKEWTGLSGTVQQEWEICTEENRKLPVALELSQLEVAVEGIALETPDTCQFYIDTAAEYYTTARKTLRETHEYKKPSGKEQDNPADWLPLVRMKLQRDSEEEKYSLSLIEDSGLRFYTIRSGEEEMLWRIEEENGIVDIRWRNLLKEFRWKQQPSLPSQELIQEEKSKCIRRGVTVIPIPGRYRRGQVLYSDEIAHGFPGEEVLIFWGVIYENRDHVYWNHSKIQYTVVQGEQKLFPRLWDTGREGGRNIERQALLQNVEKGTFQIALTLSAGFRKNRGREVAISWTAFRTG